jgi:predicted HAD superfamily Cof-like phosphohydrolase
MTEHCSGCHTQHYPDKCNGCGQGKPTNRMQQLVQLWHEAFGVAVSTQPTMVDAATRELRIALIEEEAREFAEAARAGDMVGMADALADLLYVTFGAGVTLGIDLDPVLAEVHRSNMTKLWPDGTVHYREDGKVLKPPTYSPANIAGELAKQGWNQ